ALKIDETLGVVENLAADHAHPGAVLAAGCARDAVVERPEFGAAFKAPADPFAIALVGPVVVPRQLHAGTVLELRLAVLAIADLAARQAGPAVIGKAIGLAALDDLLHHA